ARAAPWRSLHGWRGRRRWPRTTDAVRRKRCSRAAPEVSLREPTTAAAGGRCALAPHLGLQDRDLLLHELQVGALQLPVAHADGLAAEDLGLGVEIELQAVAGGGHNT